MSTRVRMSPAQRREMVLKAAVALTREADGCVLSWTQQAVADKCTAQTSPETVKRHFSQTALRAAVRARIGEHR